MFLASRNCQLLSDLLEADGKMRGRVLFLTLIAGALLCSVADAEAATFPLGRSNNDSDFYLLDEFATSSPAASPSISVQPQSQTVTAPATATFGVTATGTAPVSYQWNKNGALISGATSSNYTTPATTNGANGTGFTVTVTDSFGSTTSSPAILTVNPAPTMNSSPVGPVLIGGQPQNQMVTAPASATFSATAIGTAPITYQWNKNGAPISGATSASYTTAATTSADNGASFTVTVRNSVNGFTSAPATLTVTATPVAPTIVAGPGGISVHQGSTALFYVVAAGTTPLSYQWSKNGTPIGDATDASYIAPATTGADNNAQFKVTVTNGAGSVTSSGETLTVTSSNGLGGFWQALGNPNDLIGVQYRFQVATNQSQSGKIIFGSSTFYNPGSAINYAIEYNVYSWRLTFANGGCTTYPPLGTSTEAQASLRNATPDYPYGSGAQPAMGSAINTSDPSNWPVQTYLIDNIPHLYKSDSISQFNMNGVETLVTIQRGGTLTDVSSFQRCGLAMLSETYRMWTITTQTTDHGTVVNQVVLPEANARYVEPPPYGMTFYSEFLNSPGTFAVQYWNVAYMRESNPVWTPVSTFKTNYNYDGGGQDFGIHVVSVSGDDRIEFSNAPGNSYLPGGELPFSIAPTPGLVGNVSTRLPVGAGDNVLIEGFIVQGPVGSTKKIMVRAIGPSLTPFGITDALANPTLEIHDSNGVKVAGNDDWRTTQVGGLITGDQSAEIASSGLAPGNDLESAIIANLAPGSYTAVVSGVGNTTGTGVVDAYDLSAASPARLANIATRGLIQSGDKLMIAGFIVQNGPVKAVIRAIGPSLTAFGIVNALTDPTLQLRDQNGVVVLENDNWKTRPDGSSQQPDIEATGLQPTNDLESALVATIQPGQYTAQVRGNNQAAGIGVVQVYFLQ